MDAVEDRCDEEERELDGFGDTGEKRGERRGDHDATDFRALLGTRGAPHRDRRSGQAPHLEKVTAGHVARARVARDETRDFAMDDRAGSGIRIVAGLEEERYIPDVVQTKGNERALDDAVNGEGKRRAAMHRPV